MATDRLHTAAALEGRAYSFPADVYSFGIVMWEIAAQALPWAEVPSSNFLMNSLVQLLRAEQRPVCDAAWPEPYCGLMQRCWRTTASARPDFAAAAVELQQACDVLRRASRAKDPGSGTLGLNSHTA